MTADCLVDTGAILALLDRNDRWHAVCTEAFLHLRLPLVTSTAVLTELFHLVGDGRRDMEMAWSFIQSGAVVLATITDADLSEIHTLMSRYWFLCVLCSLCVLCAKSPTRHSFISPAGNPSTRSSPLTTLISRPTGLQAGGNSGSCPAAVPSRKNHPRHLRGWACRGTDVSLARIGYPKLHGVDFRGSRCGRRWLLRAGVGAWNLHAG